MRELKYSELMILLTEASRRLHVAACDHSEFRVDHEMELVNEYHNALILIANKEKTNGS